MYCCENPDISANFSCVRPRAFRNFLKFLPTRRRMSMQTASTSTHFQCINYNMYFS